MTFTLKKLVIFGLIACTHSATKATHESGPSQSQTEIIVISHSELAHAGQHLREKLTTAARQGFFYLEMPEDIAQLIPDSIKFAQAFGKDENLKALKLPGFSGYHDRENAQVESFYCEQSLYDHVLPAPVAHLARLLNELSVHILHELLPLVLPNLDCATWDNATGGSSSGNGLRHFSFNHYRPNKNAIGLKPHRDFGYLSLLFIDKPGLHAKIDGAWMPIMPKQGYLIVNFGKAFEILVNDPNKLIAAWHYVEQISEEKHGGDRISFVFSTDNNLDVPVQKMMPDGTLEIVYANYEEFLTASFADLYEDMDLVMNKRVFHE